jgi:hypothetical protein
MIRKPIQRAVSAATCALFAVAAIVACSTDNGTPEPTTNQVQQSVVGHPALVGEWNFSAGSGQVAADTSGNALSGQLGSTGAADDSDPTWLAVASPAALAPNALSFSKSAPSDFVKVASSPKLEHPRISVELWMKTTSDPGGGLEYLISKGGDGCTSASYAIYNSGTGLRFGIRDAGGTWRDSPAAPLASVINDAWHHVVGTYDGANLKLYLDGSLVGQTAVATTIQYGLSSHNDLLIGTYKTASCTIGYTGAIDGVRVYNEALSASDVTARSTGEPTLVGDWRLDTGSGQVATDSTGNGLNGLLGSTNGTDATDPSWVAVAAGAGVPVDAPPYALSFTPTDFVTVPNSARLERQRISLELWMKSGTAPPSNAYLAAKGAEGCSSASYAIYNSPTGVRFGVRDTGAGWMASPAVALASVIDDKWHHIVGTYDGANVKLYFDGTLVGATALAGTIQYGLSTTNDLFMGAYGNPACPLSYAGVLDEVRFYEGALSASQVSARFAESGPPPPAGPLSLIAQYSFRTGTGQRAYDSSINNLDGILGSTVLTEIEGVPVVDNSDPTWVAVPLGAPTELPPFALRFAGGGASDFVRVNNSAKLERNRISVELWMKTNSTPTQNAYLIAKGAGACHAASYAIYNSPTGLRFGAQDLTGTWRDTPAKAPASVNDGNWHHVVGTYDGGNVALYFDNALVGTAPMTGAIKYDLSSHNDLYIGSYKSEACTLGYTGQIDEVRLYREALSASQISNRFVGIELNDTDQDGSMDAIDKCASTPSTSTNYTLDYIANARGCSVAQCCPTSGPRMISDGGCPKVTLTGTWLTHGAYVSCVSNTLSQLFNQGKLTSAEVKVIKSGVIASDIGKQ